MKNKIVTIIVMAAVLALFSGCALLGVGKDTQVSVYKRDDVDTSNSKVIVFPLLLKSGGDFAQANKNADNGALDAIVGTGWTDEIGKDEIIIVPKLVLSELPQGWETLGKFIKLLDKTSSIEQTLDNPEIKKFVEGLSSKVGDGALGFALVFEDEAMFKASKTLHGNMGLFDTKKLTWKWITKYKNSYKLPVPYQVAIKDLFSESWQAIKAENDGKIK